MRKRKPNSVAGRPLWITQGLAIKITVIIAIICLAVLFTTANISRTLKNSDYFRISEVITNEGNAVDLAYLVGENIFALDLSRESGYILEQNPVYRSVRLIRIPPGRIFAYLVKRKPIAFVKLYRIFSVDADGVLFTVPQDLEILDLPLVTGLETKIFGPKVGRKYNVKELVFALNTIKAFRFYKGLRSYRIKKIDVANLNNASVFVEIALKAGLPQWMEIKLGEDGLKSRMNILATVLTQARQDLPNIKYIDLRFKEPLIKLRDGNAK